MENKLAELGRRLLILLRRRQFDIDLEEEMRLHRELREQEQTEAGMTPEEAHYAALRRFGNVALTQERSREMWGWTWLENSLRDVRYTLRQLRQSPGFTAVAVLTLALGIGSNTAIFSLVDAVLLKSLPVVNPKQLYRLGNGDNCCEMTGLQGSFILYSYPLYQQLRDHTPEFTELAAFQPSLCDLSVRRSGASAPAELYQGEFVSGNYFTTFGLNAFAGRVFTSVDDAPGAPPVAVMSYHTWQQHFNLDTSVVGSAFAINGVSFTLAGVAPPGFYGETLRSDPPDFWLPLGTEPALNRQNSMLNKAELQWLYPIGRLRPGAEVARVQSHLTVELQGWLWSRGLAEAAPQQRNDAALVEQARREIAQQHIRLTPAGSGVDRMQSEYAAGLRLLVTLSALVLLITCANIANLLLARGAAGRQQTAVRVALGAPRRRLIRQALTESVLLALVGGGAGLHVSYTATHAILMLAFRGARYVPISAQPSLPVLGFAFLVSLVTGIIFGVVPAWVTSHADPADALRGAGRSTSDRSLVSQRPLVVLQIALSVILLVGAGLLTRSLRNLEEQRFGFLTQGRLIVGVNPALAGYTPAQLPELYQELEQRLQQIPGVLGASFSGYSPMGGNNWNEDVYIEGRTPAENSGHDQNSSLDRVGAHYFETIGTRLVRGRAIDDRDTPSSRHVADINQTFARKFFPAEDPIGQHFGLGDATHSGDYEIVGIVEDAKYQNARLPAYPTAFMPLQQTSPAQAGHDGSIYIHDIELHVRGELESFEPAVRGTISGIDPDLTVLNITSFDEQVGRNFNQERLIAWLAELFGLLALILACVGLYGVTAYSAVRRTNEIGIRMALGAVRGNILNLVLRGAFTQVVLGLGIGIPAALAGARVLSSGLYGVASYDPLVVGLAAAILAACTLVAAFVPARRATRVEPLVALRCE